MGWWGVGWWGSGWWSGVVGFGVTECGVVRQDAPWLFVVPAWHRALGLSIVRLDGPTYHPCRWDRSPCASRTLSRKMRLPQARAITAKSGGPRPRFRIMRQTLPSSFSARYGYPPLGPFTVLACSSRSLCGLREGYCTTDFGAWCLRREGGRPPATALGNQTRWSDPPPRRPA